jgi:two-component system LytT family response regulator
MSHWRTMLSLGTKGMEVRHNKPGLKGRRATGSTRPNKPAIQNRQILALLEELKAASLYPRRLMVKKDGRFLLIKTANIDWIEAQGNYVRVHSGKTLHVLRRRIGQLESRLDPRTFLRANRSAIVNVDRIRELQPLSHGDIRILMDHGVELTLSRHYRRNLERLIGEE